MRRSARVVSAVFVSLLAGTFVSVSPASAAAPWNYRGLTLPRHDIAVDFGMGYGHEPAGPDGLGMNLELRAGVAHDFELGFRMGFRLDDGGQITQADYYGRPFEPETYGTEHHRGGAGPPAELLPADRDGVPLRLHVWPADRPAPRADPLRHRPLRPDH